MSPPLVPTLCRLAVGVVRFLPAALDEFAASAGGASPPREVREVLLQCHLFCGFPRTIAAMDHLRTAGVALDGEANGEVDQEASPGSPEAGAALFERIYGDGAPDVRAHLRGLDPALEAMVSAHAYGTVLTRGGLDAGARELLAVVMLAATGHDRQLASHVRGAVRCGALPTDVHAALDAVEDLVEPARMARARDVARRFTREG
ncbi:MAG: carboxymuconolactone decarboxylase family protein [Planctomycetota bacterium]|jgi:alkylhydroperoxidase/carboxymuconolactone decarboxylase family protein YurZ